LTPGLEDLSGCTILIVEDDYFIADDMAQAFRQQGARILGPVGRVDAALSIIAAEPSLDAAVLDLNLGSTMSYPIADELRRRGVPFVFSTGYDASVIPPEYRSVPRFEKPVNIPDAVRTLARLATSEPEHRPPSVP
jgi:CheY-like chemotaxis protein